MDLAAVTREGVAPEVVGVLVGQAASLGGKSSGLCRRGRSAAGRRNGRPLTANETGCFLRTVKIWAMAEAVFGSSESALAWLRKPRRSFGGISAMELLRTEAGGQAVEETLGQLDEGYFA